MSSNIPPTPTQDDKKFNTDERIENIAPDDSLEEGKPKYKANMQLDQAAKIMADAGKIDYSPEDAKRVLRMIDWRVCGAMCLVYLCQQMDKGTVSSAAVFSLQAETHLVGTQYSWLSSVVYVMELVCQPISAYALIYFPVKYWVMFNYISWSITTICTGAATNFTGLLIARIFLGCFEATILPSFVFVTQVWWTRREGTSRTTAYQIANSCASVFAPLIAFGIGHVSTGIRPYQGVFIAIGCISLAFCPLVWWMLPNSPVTAKFLNKGNDRLIALDRIKANNVGTKNAHWDWAQARECATESKTYIWMLMYFLTATPSGGFGTFGGLITKGFGFDSLTTILMQMPIGAIQIGGLLASTWFINRYKRRWLVIALLVIPPIGGAIGMLKVDRKQPVSLLICYYFALSLGTIQPQLFSWANQNAAGSTKRVMSTAMMFGAQCVGNIVGPQVYLSQESPQYFTGIYTDLGCWICLFFLICLQGWNLRRLNKKQIAKREALGLPADIQDMSIMSTAEAAAYRIELSVIMRNAGFDEEKFNENSFGDLTDTANPWFHFVI